MKKLLVLSVLLMNCLVSRGQDSTLVEPPILAPYSGQEINREKIQAHDLPDTIKESLKSQDYAGWDLETAYKASMTDPQSPESEGITVYIVELKRKNETLLIRFDKDGNKLDDIDKK